MIAGSGAIQVLVYPRCMTGVVAMKWSTDSVAKLSALRGHHVELNPFDQVVPRDTSNSKIEPPIHSVAITRLVSVVGVQAQKEPASLYRKPSPQVSRKTARTILPSVPIGRVE